MFCLMTMESFCSSLSFFPSVIPSNPCVVSQYTRTSHLYFSLLPFIVLLQIDFLPFTVRNISSFLTFSVHFRCSSPAPRFKGFIFFLFYLSALQSTAHVLAPYNSATHHFLITVFFFSRRSSITLTSVSIFPSSFCFAF